MPPKVKFQRDEIVAVALEAVREKGIDAVTAREVAQRLGVSTRPIFTWYRSMEDLRRDVFDLARSRYREHIEAGLTEPIPFLGVWRQYLMFAQTEPELYKLLFLTPPDGAAGGAVEALTFSQALARPSIMAIYHMDERAADGFFRDIWLAAFSYATLIVTGNCPYSLDEMLSVGAELSLSVCKAYKEVPGLVERTYDKDAVFRELIARET